MLSIGNMHNIANIECYPLLLMLTIVTNVVNVISQNYNFEILARFFYYIREDLLYCYNFILRLIK